MEVDSPDPPNGYKPREEHIPLVPNNEFKTVPKILKPTKEAKSFGFTHAVMITPFTYATCCYCGKVSEVDVYVYVDVDVHVDVKYASHLFYR